MCEVYDCVNCPRTVSKRLCFNSPAEGVCPNEETLHDYPTGPVLCWECRLRRSKEKAGTGNPKGGNIKNTTTEEENEQEMRRNSESLTIDAPSPASLSNDTV